MSASVSAARGTMPSMKCLGFSPAGRRHRSDEPALLGVSVREFLRMKIRQALGGVLSLRLPGVPGIAASDRDSTVSLGGYLNTDMWWGGWRPFLFDVRTERAAQLLNRSGRDGAGI